MLLVEAEGTDTLQNTYSSLDIHLGKSTLYCNSAGSVSGPPPGGPTIQIDWSLNQARSVRQNLTASGPRPNPQGSHHYGLVNTTRTIRLANSAPIINGKQRYAMNSVSYIPLGTPLKLADYFKIQGVREMGMYLTTTDSFLHARGSRELKYCLVTKNVSNHRKICKLSLEWLEWRENEHGLFK